MQKKINQLYDTAKYYYVKHKLFVWYAFIGVSGVMLHSLVFHILITYTNLKPDEGEGDGIPYAIGALCGMTNNFLLNAFFNFKSGKNNFVKRMLAFITIGLIGLVISSNIVQYLTKHLDFNSYVALLIGIIVSVSFQYPLNKRISFRNYS